MTEKENPLSEVEKEALKFLERDFNQIFLQARYYDAQIFDSFKFLFTIYLGLIGFLLTIYQFSIKEKLDVGLPIVISSLLVSIIIGLFIQVVVTRNRAYFVQTMRYINEQRQLFLAYKPLGFNNVSRMYTNPNLPDYFNWKSSQAWLSHLISFMNSIIVGLNIFLLFGLNYLAFIIVPMIILLLQLYIIKQYLEAKENNKAKNDWSNKRTAFKKSSQSTSI